MAKLGKKDKKPQLESEEKPVINYGLSPIPGFPTDVPKESVKKLLEGLTELTLIPDGEAKIFESEKSYSTVPDADQSLEIELEEARAAYQKLFKRYQDLQAKYQELEEKFNILSQSPPSAPMNEQIQHELDSVRSAIRDMFIEFQNEAAGRNPRREVHDVIFLTGEFGLINKFRKVFPFLR